MDQGHLGGALTLSPQQLSWLTPKASEGMRYRTRKYPWEAGEGGHRAEVKKEKGAQGSFGQGQDVRVGRCWQKGTTQLAPLTWLGTDFLVEKDQEYCVCEMPCNLTRYAKELSMVKIPSKASAKYLAKKFNKSEQYIG